MARAHKIEKITLFVRKMDHRNMSKLKHLSLSYLFQFDKTQQKNFAEKFIVDVNQRVKEFDIYERSENGAEIFGKPQDLWQNMIQEINNASIKMQIMNGQSHQSITDVPNQFRFRVTASF